MDHDLDLSHSLTLVLSLDTLVMLTIVTTGALILFGVFNRLRQMIVVRADGSDPISGR